ncbi:MAG TPA: hypothetical protein VF179_04230, partial [Thermoanaerobaculia bacterium]|nr:hypothetical protein [Thermoanaerobaculia bacterium]
AWRLGGDRRNTARCRAEHLEQADRPGPAAVYRERLGETERALALYARAGRWPDAARLEPARPEERRQVLPKIRELIESGGYGEAERLLAVRREALRREMPNIPGAILLGTERLAWQELVELERLEHRNAALRAEAGQTWSRAARHWTLAWEPHRAEQACRKGGRTAAWQPAPSPVIHTEEPEGHPDPGILSRLLAEVASAAEIRVLVQHLVHHGMRGCADCLREIEQTSQPPAPPLDDYDAAFDRVHEKIARGQIQGLSREIPPLKGLHAEVFEHTYVQMLLAMHGTRRATDLSLCELLLRQSRELGARDPVRARRAAELAAQTAELVHEGLYGSPVVQDAHTWSWAQPDVERVSKGEDRLVVNITDKIRQLLAWEPDPPMRAGLLALQAFLAGSRGRIDEAVRVFNRAASIHRRTGDRHLFGRVLLQKGILLGSTREGGQRHAVALRLIRRSLDLVDPAREPRLVVNAAHHLIWFQSQAGRTAEAEACLHAARRLYERAGDRRHLGRLFWLEGKIAVRPREAEVALVAARDALHREGLGHEAALATLDLGALYVRERREVDVRRQPELVFALASSGSVLRDTTFLVETAGGLAREEPAAPLLDELSNWMERLHRENNPSSLVPSA